MTAASATEQPPPRFRRLDLQGWRQFARVEVVFHDRLTVLTGANGAGKTTLLNLLAQHFGWSLPLVSTPVGRKGGQLQYLFGAWARTLVPDEAIQIGTLEYTTGTTTPLIVPAGSGEIYSVSIPQAQAVPGIFVPSHRPVYFYQRVTEIPTTLSARQQILELYLNEVRARFGGGGGRSPSSRLKESLISLATFGYGNEVVQPNPDAIRIFEGFQDVLRRVLPPTIGFRRLVIRMPELVFETETGDFAFEAMSGGMAAILDLAWQIYMRSSVTPGCTAIIDEPENHLHPSLQQGLLPSFVDAFPDVQFIVATHNPFVVGSVPSSNVYVLAYEREPEGRSVVHSTPLDIVNKSGTANEILRDVLGLPFTVPLWVAHELREIVGRYSDQELDEAMLREFRGEMTRLGFEDLIPETLSQLIDRRRAKDDPAQ